jgi:hypothetical protein
MAFELMVTCNKPSLLMSPYFHLKSKLCRARALASAEWWTASCNKDISKKCLLLVRQWWAAGGTNADAATQQPSSVPSFSEIYCMFAGVA